MRIPNPGARQSRCNALRQASAIAAEKEPGLAHNGSMRGLGISLLLLGACASAPPGRPAASWTYEISHDDHGYCETERGPTYPTRAAADAALTAHLRAHDYRGPRAAVMSVD